MNFYLRKATVEVLEELVVCIDQLAYVRVCLSRHIISGYMKNNISRSRDIHAECSSISPVGTITVTRNEANNGTIPSTSEAKCLTWSFAKNFDLNQLSLNLPWPDGRVYFWCNNKNHTFQNDVLRLQSLVLLQNG